MMESRTEIFDSSSSIVSAGLGAEIVLLDTESGEYFGLNETAALIWRQLGEGRTPEEIAAELERAYEVDPAEARADVETYVDLLRERRLIRQRT
jgi:PqqD family protein of HPr-rel-A system